MSLLDFIPVLGDLIDTIKKVVPDTAARDQIAGQLDIMRTAIAAKQGDVTAVEASSASLFKSGWRPAVGWVCVTGLVLHYLVFPLASLALQLAGHVAIASPLDIQSLIMLLGTLLGFGSMRSFERAQGKA